VKRLIAAVVMTSYLAACSAWRAQEAAPKQAVLARITLADGRRLLLRDPQVIGDSLVGFVAQGPGNPYGRVRVAFLATDVRRIEGRKVDAGKTALALIALGAAIALGVALSNIQTTDPNH
jgi:hypothetical protein